MLALAMGSPRAQAAVVVTYAASCRLRARTSDARELFSLVSGHPAATLRQRHEAARALEELSATGTELRAGDPATREGFTFEQTLDRLLHEQR